MITPLVRFTYTQVWEPKANLSGQLKYSTGLLIAKTDTKALAAIKAEIEKANSSALAKNVYTADATKRKTFKYPLRDGDEYYTEKPDGTREAYRGHMFVNASANSQPGVVDRYSKPIMDQDEFYSGCFGLADVNFYGYNKGGGVGIGCGLNNLMKKKDGDRLDGRQSAESAFAGQVDNDEDESNLE